jgi:hypothetical protein
MWPISSCKKVRKCCNPHIYWWIRVITKLPNSEQSYKGKVKTHKYTLQSQEILNRPVFVLEILKSVWKLLKILKRFWTLLKILNRFWKLLKILNRFWTDSENSEQILNIAENSEQILNITENSEQILNNIFLLKSIYLTSFSLDFN